MKSETAPDPPMGRQPSRRLVCASGLTFLGGLASMSSGFGAVEALAAALRPRDTSAMPSSYLNPVIPGDHPDAGAIRVDEDFYLTHSSFNYTPGLTIWHSRNLVDWTPVASALKQFIGVVWAPFLCQHNHRYYIYFPANACIHVTHAASPLGPWSDPVDLNLPGIDPGHLATPDGRRLLYLAGGRMVELAADGLSCMGRPREVFAAWPIPREWRIECQCLEAPKPFFKDSFYYLLAAEGGTSGPATSHMVIAARSRNPDGPWEYSPWNPIVHTRTRGQRWWSQGHGRLVEAADGSWWMTLHGYENGYRGLGRQTLLLPVQWTEDGWFRIPEGVEAGEALTRPAASKTSLPPESGRSPWRDDFTGAELDPRWQFWNGYDRRRLSTGPGGLVLQADGKEIEQTSVLCTVAGFHAYSVEVEVEIEEGCRAGLMLFYDAKHLCGLGLARDGIEFRSPVGDTYPLGIPARRAAFKLLNDRQEVDLFYRLPGEPWKQVEGSMEVSGLNQNVLGGFLSLRPALYAASAGRAIFRNFRLEQLEEAGA